VLLVDEAQLALVERLEPLVPGDRLEVAAAVSGEVEPENSRPVVRVPFPC